MSKRLGLNEWWAVQETSDGFIYVGTISGTRPRAIGEFDTGWTYPRYRALRRRGEVRCIRVRIVPAEEGK